MNPDWRDICDRFIQATSYADKQESKQYWRDRPSYDYAKHDPYLTYPDAVVRVELSEPDFSQPCPDLWRVIGRRRSRRNFLDVPITLNELNLMLWGTQGVTGELERGRPGYKLRTVPSSGALYPIETYMLVNNVEGLDPGLYHLDVLNWTLEGLKIEDVREISYKAAWEQEMTRRAGVNFVWTAVLPRCRDKYYERAYRYVFWDVGHIAQNLHIVGNALGLGVCSIGAWYDGMINQYLGIDGVEHLSILMATAGKVKGEDWIADRRAI